METRGLFVTGTDTGVGKTRVAALIANETAANGLCAGAYKPVCSGAVTGNGIRPVWEDVAILSQAIGAGFSDDRVCPQRFQAAVAPPVAARLEGKSVDSALLRDGAFWWRRRVDLLVVEGAGGLLCPLSESDVVADLAASLQLPLVIVVRLGLGSINHALLTVEAAKSRKLAIAGLVLNEVDPPESTAADRDEPAQIARRSGVPILGVMSHNQPRRLLRDGAAARIDWWSLATPMAAGT